MKKILTGFVSSFALLFMMSGVALAASPYQSGSTGVDVSYPNCTAKLPSVSFGIVGTEAGLGFTQNPCIISEASHFANLSLYANTGYPGSGSANAQAYMNTPLACGASDLNCIAYDYGYNQGLFAYNYAATLGVYSSVWWLDAENNTTWISNVVQNQHSLLGEHDALVAKGATTVGAYSTTAQWNAITGSWHNTWPSWGATTWTSASQAQKYCTGHEFTGGPSLLMQFKSKKSTTDQDVAC